jgi:hypothetical protein
MLTCIIFYSFLFSPTVSSTSSSNINGDVPVSEPSKSTNLLLSAELSGPVGLSPQGSPLNNAELSFFNFSIIEIATNNFSEENKLGQGGFGPVYKVNTLLLI